MTATDLTRCKHVRQQVAAADISHEEAVPTSPAGIQWQMLAASVSHSAWCVLSTHTLILVTPAFDMQARTTGCDCQQRRVSYPTTTWQCSGSWRTLLILGAGRWQTCRQSVSSAWQVGMHCKMWMSVGVW
jgi:hypothetical protein